MENAKEQERVHTAQNATYILSDSYPSLSSDDSSETFSDDSSDSGARQNPTKLVSSSNKSSTFQAKLRSDNKETILKQTHHDDFTPKQDILERIKRLHKRCGFLDTEHVFMLPFKWLNHREVPDVIV